MSTSPGARRTLGLPAILPLVTLPALAGACGGPTPRVVDQTPQRDHATIMALWGSGPRDVWAAGQREDNAAGQCAQVFSPPQGYRAYMLHWDGTRWSPATLPGGVAWINGLWGSGPRDVWAVGQSCPAGSTAASVVVLHFDGSAWSVSWQEPTPAVMTGLNRPDIGGSGAGDVWVVGLSLPDMPDAPSPLAHWNGTQWAVVDGPVAGAALSTVWLSGPNDLWAATTDTPYRFDGAQWSEVGLGEVPVQTILAVRGTSASNVWLTTEHGVRRWNNRDFATRLGGLDQVVQAFFPVTSNDLWAATVTVTYHDCIVTTPGVGEVPGSCPESHPAVAHWDGASWSVGAASSANTALTYGAIWSAGRGEPAWFAGDTLDQYP